MSSPLALDKVKNPGRRGAEIEIAPVRGDVTNGKGQRVTNPPKGIMHGKVPYKRKFATPQRQSEYNKLLGDILFL